MKLKNPRITMLFNDNGATIELYDREAGISFIEVVLNQEQVCQMFSRLSNTECSVEVYNLHKVGKKQILQNFEFEIPKTRWEITKEEVIAICKQLCPNEWEPDLDFNYQNSFFSKEGKHYACTVLRRWE